MTEKLKLFLVLLFTSSIFLNSCDKDFEEDISSTNNHNTSNSNLKVSKIYFKDFKDNINLLTEIEKSIGKPKTSLNQRIIQSSDKSFYIDTDFAYFIEDDNGNHSYTFQIIRDNPQYLLENLIFNSNNHDSYDVFITQYNITEQEYLELEHGNNPDLSSKVTLTPINGTIIDINTIFARGSVEEMCLTTTVISGNTCPGSEHHTLDDVLNGANCPYFSSGSFTLYREQVIYSWEPCGEEEGGGGGNNYGDTGGTGGIGGTGGTGDGTSSNNGDSDSTNPNQSEDIEDTENPVNTTPVLANITEPCETLAQLSDLTIDSANDFSNKVNELKNKITSNQTNEWAFSIERTTSYNATTNENNTDYNTTDIIEGDVTSSKTWKGDDYIGGVHTHPKLGHAVFSWSDIRNLKLTHNEAHRGNKKHVFYMVVSTNPNNSNQPLIYSIKVNDIIKLQAKIDEDWNDLELVSDYPDEKEREIEINRILGIKYDENKSNLEKYFLQKFGDYGIDLYKAQNGNLNDWAKLNLDNNSSGQLDAIPQPCNN